MIGNGGQKYIKSHEVYTTSKNGRTTHNIIRENFL
jgi:hypothetical protein